MGEEIPQWAFRRVAKLCSQEPLKTGDVFTEDSVAGWEGTIAFARYIAAHEEPPVDPAVVAGRKLVAETQHNWPESPWHMHEAAETLAGNRDFTLVVKAAIEGVRRGIDLGKSHD